MACCFLFFQRAGQWWGLWTRSAVCLFVCLCCLLCPVLSASSSYLGMLHQMNYLLVSCCVLFSQQVVHIWECYTRWTTCLCCLLCPVLSTSSSYLGMLHQMNYLLALLVVSCFSQQAAQWWGCSTRSAVCWLVCVAPCVLYSKASRSVVGTWHQVTCLLFYCLWNNKACDPVLQQEGGMLHSVDKLVSRCFKPSQPQKIISGLMETFIKRYIVESTSKAEIRPEEQSEKMESWRENLWNEIQLKGP